MANLRIEGEVAAPRALALGDLEALPGQIDDVSRFVPGRAGRAVRLESILKLARPGAAATHLTLVSADGSFSASAPLEAVRDALVVYALGGEPLPVAQGGPLRFLIPRVEECATGAVDACSNVKALSLIRLTRGPEPDTRPATRESHAELHRHKG
jgi:DMSO/TMAO reductase YedYZ molybdopterin-dependent catalytic subunit